MKTYEYLLRMENAVEMCWKMHWEKMENVAKCEAGSISPPPPTTTHEKVHKNSTKLFKNCTKLHETITTSGTRKIRNTRKRKKMFKRINVCEQKPVGKTAWKSAWKITRTTTVQNCTKLHKTARKTARNRKNVLSVSSSSSANSPASTTGGSSWAAVRLEEAPWFDEGFDEEEDLKDDDEEDMEDLEDNEEEAGAEFFKRWSAAASALPSLFF